MTKKMTIKDAVAMIDALTRRVEELETQLYAQKKGKKGMPKSTRPMTEEDAKRVTFGDLKDMSHADAARELGLSYGQIYSARNGYTFNYIKEENK